MDTLGRFLIILGLIFIGLGVIFILGGKISWFGRIPGDILIEKKNFTFYFPLATCLLLSLLLTLILLFVNRFIK
ncbi:MAG: DUF2905 domain-containing protein [Candidatus Omnitrophica bacterium]|nr:DUF2905 domain-containing protein [Candidatus Omnitrophota bacterium]MCM8798037.1 DUF2905 domain-containing protein [Candidatus Omnitrophota bacterium]